ncbi:MAG: S1 RNA-binding domain-containing protein, partial [Acidobacteriaceae bacterium]
MVNVLNPEHTESKTLNTTLEANEVAAAETQTDASEPNHNISASAETQPTLSQPADTLEHAGDSIGNHAQSDSAAQDETATQVATANQDAPEETSADEEMDFGALLESFEHEQAAQEAAQAVDGNVITGTVIKLTDKHVVVDVGLKSEGLIPLEQVLDHTGQPKLEPGQSVEVVVEREEPGGVYLLSYDKALRHRVWDTIEKAANDKIPVNGLVVSRVKGGLTVDIGMKAFLPGSQVEIRPVRNLESYI